MSWDSYIVSMIDHSKKNLCAGAIISTEGVVWGQIDMALTQPEITAIVHAFKTNDHSKLRSDGVCCHGLKYMFLQSDDKQIQAKKKDNGGLSFAKAKTCIIIGKYAEGASAGLGRTAVEYICEHLEKSGF